MGEFERAKWPRQIVAVAIWGVIIAWKNYVPHLFLPHSTYPFLPLMWLDAASGIWFGGWGVAAACVGTTIGHGPALGFEVSALCSLGTILAALVPAWAFRRFKGDPRLKTSRDGVLFLLFGVIVPSFVSTFITPPIWYLFGFAPNIAALTQAMMPGWFFWSAISTPIFGFPLLLIFSRIHVHVRAYCKGWFS